MKITSILFALLLSGLTVLAQNQLDRNTRFVNANAGGLGKEFVRFSAFPAKSDIDRKVLVEVCQADAETMACKPLGKGYYSLAAIKKIADDSMAKGHLSAVGLAGVAALTAALAIPVLGVITVSGILVIGTTGPVGGFIIGAGLAATTLYFFGMRPRHAAAVATPAGIFSALAAVSASTSLLSSLLVLSGFAYSVAIPFSAGWKALDIVGLNPIKNYSRAFTLREVYKNAGESGSTDQIETVKDILKMLDPVAPFADSNLLPSIQGIP